eukprot:Skav230497  [mRNA]  locus=scaffold2389:164415:165983:- [translate_table: standard]
MQVANTVVAFCFEERELGEALCALWVEDAPGSCVQEPSAQEPSECGGDWALWRTSPTLTRRLAPSFAGSGRRSALDAYKRSAGGCDSDLSEVRRRKGDEASSGEALPLNPRGNRQP